MNGASGSFTANGNNAAGAGGAGHIRINTTTGVATLGGAAMLSPAPSTPCATEGKLAR